MLFEGFEQINIPPENGYRRDGEHCNHCGAGVSFGSGRFVNRVPDLNDVGTRMANGLAYPLGDFVCQDCDLHSLTDND